jgi:uncharacterized protein
MSASTNSQSRPLPVVIDTQAVLDCWYFGDPLYAGWSPALDAGTWQWMATEAMRQELSWVLDRGFGPRWPGDASAVLAAFDRHAKLRRAPELPLAGGLRCSDPDDQKFIDLAVSIGPCHLVTRDRALLKLGRKALARHGVQVCRPGEWMEAKPYTARP